MPGRRWIPVLALLAAVAVAGFAAHRLASGLGGVDERGARVSTAQIRSRAVGDRLATTVALGQICGA